MRLATLVVFALALVPALALAGCAERSSPVEVTPFYVLNDAQPGRPTEFAFFLRSTSPFKQELDVRAEAPEGWEAKAEVDNLTIRGRATTSLIVTVKPADDASYEPHDVNVYVGDTRARVIVNVRDLGREPLRQDLGTTLYYVLWYANGTLASTNDAALHNRSALGQPVLDGNETFTEPLKVFVGGTRGTDPPEPYNATGYRAVITGFDEELQHGGPGASGMVAGETLAVRIPKEKAYTIAGNEDHVLYGEDLNFLIRIVTVDLLKKRTCDLPVCPPPTPVPP